ncbi:unnamed protein product [Caenorhabditis brenneri]
MNFQSIIIFYHVAVFCFTIVIGEPGFLTSDKNTEQLRECGIQGAANITDQSPWLWVATVTDVFNQQQLEKTAASMISPRHFLTSAHVVLREDMQWRSGKGKFEKDMSCMTRSDNAQVPAHILSDLKIYRNECIPSTYPGEVLPPLCESEFKVEPVKAYILRMCDKTIFDMFKHEAAPMIVEVDRPILPSYAPYSYRCVSNSTTEVEVGDSVYLLKILDEKEPIKELKVHSLLPNLITTENYVFPSSNGGRGNPLMKMINWKWTIVGVATHNLDLSLYNKFHDLNWFHKDICMLTGICEGRHVSAGTTETVTQKPESTTSPQASPTVPTVTQQSPNTTQPVPDHFEASTTLQLQPILTISNEIEIEIEETEPHDYLHDETVFREIENREDLRSEFYDDEDEKDLGNGSGIRELFIGFIVVLGFFK